MILGRQNEGSLLGLSPIQLLPLLYKNEKSEDDESSVYSQTWASKHRDSGPARLPSSPGRAFSPVEPEGPLPLLYHQLQTVVTVYSGAQGRFQKVSGLRVVGCRSQDARYVKGSDLRAAGRLEIVRFYPNGATHPLRRYLSFFNCLRSQSSGVGSKVEINRSTPPGHGSILCWPPSSLGHFNLIHRIVDIAIALLAVGAPSLLELW